MPSPTVRRYIYGVAIAAVPLLITYGIVTQEAAPQWVAVLGAVLVPSLAVVNVTEDQADEGAQDDGQGGRHRREQW